MTPFDVLFILLFLTAVGVVVSALVTALRGHRAAALHRLRTLALATLVYLAIVAVTSLLTPRADATLDEKQCSDDWCIAVSDAKPLSDTTILVFFQLTSRARRVTQRERFVVTYLLDSAGHRYDPNPAPDQPPFDVPLGPGESVGTERVFRVSRNARGLGVVVTREGDVPFPRCCIIGTGFFHKDPIVVLP